MVDTLALGASGGNPVEVQVLSRPPGIIRLDFDQYNCYNLHL